MLKMYLNTFFYTISSAKRNITKTLIRVIKSCIKGTSEGIIDDSNHDFLGLTDNMDDENNNTDDVELDYSSPMYEATPDQIKLCVEYTRDISNNGKPYPPIEILQEFHEFIHGHFKAHPSDILVKDTQQNMGCFIDSPNTSWCMMQGCNFWYEGTLLIVNKRDELTVGQMESISNGYAMLLHECNGLRCWILGNKTSFAGLINSTKYSIAGLTIPRHGKKINCLMVVHQYGKFVGLGKSSRTIGNGEELYWEYEKGELHVDVLESETVSTTISTNLILTGRSTRNNTIPRLGFESSEVEVKRPPTKKSKTMSAADYKVELIKMTALHAAAVKELQAVTTQKGKRRSQEGDDSALQLKLKQARDEGYKAGQQARTILVKEKQYSQAQLDLTVSEGIRNHDIMKAQQESDDFDKSDDFDRLFDGI